LGTDSCDDYVLRKASRGLVSFVYGQTIDGEGLAKQAMNKIKAAKENQSAESKDDCTNGTPSAAQPSVAKEKSSKTRPSQKYLSSSSDDDDDDDAEDGSAVKLNDMEVEE